MLLVPMQSTSLSEEALEEDGYEEDEDRDEEDSRKPAQMVSRQVRTACATLDIAHCLYPYALPYASHWQGDTFDPQSWSRPASGVLYKSAGVVVEIILRDYLRAGCRLPLPAPSIQNVQDSKAEACKRAPVCLAKSEQQ